MRERCEAISCIHKETRIEELRRLDMIEAETATLAVPVNERDHLVGSTNARVTVVNYGDYQCPGCQKRHRSTEKMARELLDRVRLVYRHFPLVKSHPRALRAAEAAEAAAAQGKFWEMHRQLYLRPDRLRDRDLRSHAKEIKLDLERFDREMAGGIYSDQILRDFYFSLNHGITGTPTTFINGVLYAKSGVELVEAVKAIMEEQRVIEQ
jgi:protein-disulfide isomerase